jgi:hypothetical protein
MYIETLEREVEEQYAERSSDYDAEQIAAFYVW